MDESPRYYPAALACALDLVRRATSENTAHIVAALIDARGGSRDRSFDLQTVTDIAGLDDLETTRYRVVSASRAFQAEFGVSVIGSDALATALGVADASGNDEEDGTGAGPAGETSDRVCLAAAFVDLLDRPVPVVAPADAPDPDPSMAPWLAITAACPKSGRGHHLALRCFDCSPREPTDMARHMASRGADVRLTDRREGIKLSVLRAELHGGPIPALVFVDRQLVSAPEADDEDALDRPVVAVAPRGRLSAEETSRIRLLHEVRNTYVWRASADFVVGAELAAFFGAAIGPVTPSRRWRDSVIAGMAPGLGGSGSRALAGRVADPRDATALAAMASVAASALGISLDDSAVLVAGSLSASRSAVPEIPADFDARLVVCDEEGQLLLARAQELARHGGRVLLWGPPGGGKSTFAQALAAAMGRAAQTVTGASILARHWGVTERIIADIWSRASEDGTTLVIDEIDSLCAAREPGASSGNAYLIRTLTNEFLRAFDTHASVPVIATANHLEAIDDAIRRRFTFVIAVRGELTPEAEALAWRALLRVEPPDGWTPVGANVSDFANAARRCRMLGLADAASLAAAVERSRDARIGPRQTPSRDKRVLQ